MQQRLVLAICSGLIVTGIGSFPTSARAQDKVTTEVIDGVTYEVVRRPVTNYIPVVEHQTKQETFYRPLVSTQYQTHQQTYLTPVTEYKYVPRLAGRWNPFVQPYWVYEYQPVTRWESRPTTVQIPLTKTDMIPETRTTQIPVTTYRPRQEMVVVQMTKKSGTPSEPGTAVANQATNDWRASNTFGSQQLQSDPPKSPYEKPATSGSRY